MTPKAGLFPVSRRRFLAGSAALAGTASVRLPRAFAAARYTRKSLATPDVVPDLVSYKKAVKAMLALPPSDPRNWYRNAFTHLMDCPHSNWWFLVWHRGFLAHFEQICRELSGDPKFALPFWDWTKEQRIPASFFDDVLDPNVNAYVPSLDQFRRDYRPAVQAYWNGLSSAQREQQTLRGYGNFDALWSAAESAFYPQGSARRLTRDNPELPPRTRATVQPSVIRDLLAPSEFVTAQGNPAFESVRAGNHNETPGSYSILEGQPHNQVHNGIGGFMLQFLSPTDPIFFMHHCNIDRLWDVWTRKQQANGKSTRPPANLWDAYRTQPFLFFHEADGSPATATTAEDYFRIAPFDYDYAPGSGSQLPAAAVAAAAIPTAGTENLSLAFGARDGASATVALPQDLSNRLAAAEAPERFFATVTITPPMQRLGVAFNVFVAPADGKLDTDPDGENFAGTFSFFGPGHGQRPASFTVGITQAVTRLRAAGALKPGQDLQVAVRAEPTDSAQVMAESLADRPALLNGVRIGAF